MKNIINRYLNEILIKKAFVSNVPVSDFFPNRKTLEKWASRSPFVYFDYVTVVTSCLQFPRFLRLKLRVSHPHESDTSAMIRDTWFLRGKGEMVRGNATWADKRSRTWRFSRDDVTSDGSLLTKRCSSYIRKLERDYHHGRVDVKGTSAIERGGMMKRVICLRGPKILTVLNTKNIACGYEVVKAWQRQMHPLVVKACECMHKCWPVHWMTVIGRWLQNSLPRLGP